VSLDAKKPVKDFVFDNFEAYVKEADPEMIKKILYN